MDLSKNTSEEESPKIPSENTGRKQTASGNLPSARSPATGKKQSLEKETEQTQKIKVSRLSSDLAPQLSCSFTRKSSEKIQASTQTNYHIPPSNKSDNTQQESLIHRCEGTSDEVTQGAQNLLMFFTSRGSRNFGKR